MTSVEAAWVREVVWPPTYREKDGPDGRGDRWGSCVCEPRVCPRCDGYGNPLLVFHATCMSRTDIARGLWPVAAEARVTDFQGRTLGPRLWRAQGPPCRWRCSCPCDKEAPVSRTVRLSPAPKPAQEPNGQSALFELPGRR